MERVARVSEIIGVLEQRVSVEDDTISEYRVRMEVIFVLEA
jgi:flavin-binding protein dodecin